MVTVRAVESAVGSALRLKQRSEEKLRQRLYRATYAARWNGYRREPGTDIAPMVDRAFASWVQAEVEDVVIEPGWTITGSDPSRVNLELDGIRATARHEDVVQHQQHSATAEIRRPAVRLWRVPGFFSRSHLDNSEAPMTRIYLNLRPLDVAWLLRDVARSLEGIPYFMKVLSHPSRYYRADAGLVMVPSPQEGVALQQIDSVRQRFGINLSPATPLLTHQHDRGIGVADDPDDLPLYRGRRGSHGEWVTQWLLDAIGDSDDVTEATAAMAGAIAASGRDPECPHRRMPSSRPSLTPETPADDIDAI